ncbi:MAG: alpha/beta fold hydrolase [Anaerolineae bacterium]|nr:alpha/beta fold hydrolase [Anaerolineae bacterium]
MHDACFWLLIPAGLALAVLAAGLGLSFHLTRRQYLSEVHTPSEHGLDFEEVTFAATDGLALRGWWIPAPGSDRAVIIMHGHGGSMDWDVHRAPPFHQAGFGVLLFDFRAHGRSEGRLATFGYLERRDVLGAVAFLKSRGVRRIGLLGFSYGGMAAILAAPDCPEVRAVVSDGGPARLRTAIAGRGTELGLPRWLVRPLAWWTVAITSARLGVNLFHYEPVRWVGKLSPRPILFVHGELDHYCTDFDDLFAAASEPRAVWRLPGVGHTEASERYPEEFQRRVLEFFQAHM